LSPLSLYIQIMSLRTREATVTVRIGADTVISRYQSKAEASEADKEILQAIQDKLAKASVPFWTALTSLGQVKEWPASLEISAGFFAVKGTGGISVAFGRYQISHRIVEMILRSLFTRHSLASIHRVNRVFRGVSTRKVPPELGQWERLKLSKSESLGLAKVKRASLTWGYPLQVLSAERLWT
jgi:hypothetical protein